MVVDGLAHSLQDYDEDIRQPPHIPDSHAPTTHGTPTVVNSCYAEKPSFNLNRTHDDSVDPTRCVKLLSGLSHRRQPMRAASVQHHYNHNNTDVQCHYDDEPRCTTTGCDSDTPTRCMYATTTTTNGAGYHQNPTYVHCTSDMSLWETAT